MKSSSPLNPVAVDVRRLKLLSGKEFRVSSRRLLRAQRAFTLIELILAIGVMSMTLIAINAVFFTALKLHRSTTDSVDAALPLERTLTTMRGDLQGAMPPSADGILSGSFKVGNVATLGLGQPADLELSTTTGVLRDDEPWSEVQRVAYYLRPSGNSSVRGQDLYRGVTRNLLSTMTPQPDEQYLLSGVERLEISCSDGLTWYNTWDSTVTTNLPVAVRVRLQMANQSSGGGTAQPIEMIVPVDSQTRTNTGTSTDTGTTTQ